MTDVVTSRPTDWIIATKFRQRVWYSENHHIQLAGRIMITERVWYTGIATPRYRSSSNKTIPMAALNINVYMYVYYTPVRHKRQTKQGF